MTLRTPYDGAPYYCQMCGAPFYAMKECKRNICDREDVNEAKKRLSNLQAIKLEIVLESPNG